MQWSVPQNWLRRVAARLAPVLARLSARRMELGVALALTAFFVLLGGVRTGAALAGLGAVVAWTAFWPAEDFAALARAGGLGAPSGDAERLWRLVIDAVPEPAIALDNAGQIIHANHRAEELFGTRRRGGHVASMSRDPELLAAVDEALVSGEGRAVELQTRVPVERRLLAMVAALDYSASRGGGPTLLISFRDLTDQDRLARMRADFVANASHELRTPLASLRGFVETLQGAAKDDAEARERFLKVMSEQAERMSRLVDDLLSLSRVEMREHLPPVERVDLNDALTRVIQALQPLAAKTGTTIAFQELDETALIRGDRDEIVQVFQNLIQNAVKYGKAKGRIEVRVDREAVVAGRAARFLVSVKDEGPGIAPQHLPRLTERFYRVNVAASREKGGTGLGLAIVKHILNRHRGELMVASIVGQGSTFTVALPVAHD